MRVAKPSFTEAYLQRMGSASHPRGGGAGAGARAGAGLAGARRLCAGACAQVRTLLVGARILNVEHAKAAVWCIERALQYRCNF